VKKSEQTREAILNAAVDCLCEGGFHGLTLTRIAETAGVTRGCLRYYFSSLEDLSHALVDHVARAKWRRHVENIQTRPDRQDAIAYAVSLVADPVEDRYRIARMELTVAARTLPTLRAAIERSTEEIEVEKIRVIEELFEQPGVASQPNFMAARDLAALVDDWLFMQCLPAPAEGRREVILRAVALALFTIWRAPPGALDVSQPKLRIRVPAGEAASEELRTRQEPA